VLRCPECGAAVRYIPSGFSGSSGGVFVVDAEAGELVTESGRVIQGYPRHECPQKTPKEGENASGSEAGGKNKA